MSDLDQTREEHVDAVLEVAMADMVALRLARREGDEVECAYWSAKFWTTVGDLDSEGKDEAIAILLQEVPEFGQRLDEALKALHEAKSAKVPRKWFR